MRRYLYQYLCNSKHLSTAASLQTNTGRACKKKKKKKKKGGGVPIDLSWHFVTWCLEKIRDKNHFVSGAGAF